MEEDLILLIELIEQKLNWGDGIDWSVHEFETLREEILEATGQAISVTTLKRIWGKAKQENKPSKSTLNILAQFAGFDNWNHFKQKQQLPSHRVNTAKSRFSFILFIVFVLAVVLYLIFSKTKTPTTLPLSAIQQISFKVEKTSSNLPSSVQFTYDLGDLEHDGFAIRLPRNENATFQLEKQSGVYSTTFYYPGYSRAELVKDTVPIKDKTLYFPTEGWELILNKSSLNFPIYSEREDVILDSTLRLNATNFSDINAIQDYVNFWLSNVKENPWLDGQNFNLTCTFRMPEAFDKSPCKVATIIVHGEKADMGFGFCIPGCVGSLNFYLANENLSGRTNDLKAFGMDLREWVEVELRYDSPQLIILANEKVILEYNLEDGPGKIGGLSFVFDGFGEVRKARLSDTNQNWDLLKDY